MASRMLLLVLLASAVSASPTPASPLVDRQSCSPATDIPSVSVSLLPNPFTFADGTEVTTAEQWTCRQEEILNAFEQYELGDLPGPPDSLEASFSGNTLSISVTVGGASASFSASISKGSGASPQGAMITVGGSSIPIAGDLATITFSNDAFAQQSGGSSRGIGTFYDLHGSDHSAGALAAWAWGISRVIDALEHLGPDTTGIDTSRLGVTGCSRNGKGAFVAGALEPRIALTVPQESGAGGAACWRVSDAEKAAGKNIQTAEQIVGENVWFSPRFNAWTTQTGSLPYDHHMLAGLVAPRGLYVPENNIDWLGPVSTTACMRAGRLVYEALGVSGHFGFSLVGGHNHCQFPSSQEGELSQFVDYFLLGGSTPPEVIDKSEEPVQAADWIDWEAPVLS
ncbi:carbohydrate-binding module 1 [Amphichorda felina]